MTREEAIANTIDKIERIIGYVNNQQFITASLEFATKCALCNTYINITRFGGLFPCYSCPLRKVTKTCLKKKSLYFSIRANLKLKNKYESLKLLQEAKEILKKL